MQAVQISRGFTEDERPRAAALYWEAFGQKLRAGFADDAAGRAVVHSGLRPQQMLVARRDGSLVGVCGFYRDGAGAVDLTWPLLRRSLSVPATVRALFMLSVLSRPSRRETLVLDGICVEPSARDLGVGTALLAAASRHARHQGDRSVQLSVVDSNPRARALYERRGFTPVDEGALGLLSPLYGFDRYTTLELKIA